MSEQMFPPPLHVYRASAGAGKTFTLAAEYIANLVNDFHHGVNEPHRHQLAITFTRKATAEMKERVLQYLYDLSHSEEVADDFFQAVRARVDPTVSDTTLRSDAGRFLMQILHGYDYFRVTTIDSFFQSLLTHLAHDLGLSASFRVDLNDDEVLSKAVDSLLQNLRPDELAAARGEDLLNWVVQYIESRLQEDQSWNVAGKLKELGRELGREPYMKHGDRLRALPLDSGHVMAYRKKLTAMEHAVRRGLQQKAKDVRNFIEQTKGFGSISNGNRWYAGFLNRYESWMFANRDQYKPSATIERATQDPLVLLTKANQKNSELVAWAEEVSTRLRRLVEAIEGGMFTINSCQLSMRHLNPLRLLENISLRMRDLTTENDTFLLSHTPLLFSRMVGTNEAPFVFERAGTMFRHIMIDEFQDTSELQWENLRHLFIENMAQGNTCMLVGDVKQGIYRWRGGDWRALAGFERSQDTQVTSLDQNFRSGARIVEFNNLCFALAGYVLDRIDAVCTKADDLLNLMPGEKRLEDTAAEEPKTELGRMYRLENVRQEPVRPGGFVRLRWEMKMEDDAEVSEESRDVDAAYDATSENSNLVDLGQQILRLHEAGVPFEQMAILVRRNAECETILRSFERAEAFARIPLVSDEAFLLSSSPAVQTLVHALRFLRNTDDGIARAYLLRHCTAEEWPRVEDILLEWQRQVAADVPFYELLQRLITLFHLDSMEGQAPYLYTFLDAVLQFLGENVSDIKRFVQHWDEVLHKRSIPSTVVKGVRLLTIHKSKGLAFHTVFMPFCNWPLEADRTTDLLWVEPRVEGYADIPLLPVPMNATTEESIYREDYRLEHLNRRIENLNLMYVAFTRARQNLVVNVPIPRRRSELTMGDVLQAAVFAPSGDLRPDLLSAKDQSGDSPGVFSETVGERVVEWGMPSILECPVVQPSGSECSAFPQVELSVRPKHPLKYETHAEELPFRLYHPDLLFRQSNSAQAFQADLMRPFAEGGVPDVDESGSARREGLLLHAVMERIERASDLDRVVRTFALEGRFLEPDREREVRDFLHRALQHPEVQEWFDGSWRLYRECTLLFRNAYGEQAHVRPDRVLMRGDETVVVDYKFGHPDRKYVDQVREYCHLLRRMGRPAVRGYLWYVVRGEVERVV